MSNEKPAVLEERITRVLANARITSLELTQLIPDAEAALAAAAATAEAEREKALDAVASRDSAKAEQSAWAAEFRRDRWRSSLTRLRQRLGEVEASERQRDWVEDYDTVKAKRDAVAKEFAERYPTLTAELCDLFRRAEAVDEECSTHQWRRAERRAPPLAWRRTQGA